MLIYPFTEPVALTDTIYVQHGGETGTTTAFQRSVAHTAAEEQVSTYINALLVPTTLTGTYSTHGGRPLTTDWGRVQSIDSVTLKYFQWDTDCSITETTTCAYILDTGFGVILPNYTANCNCFIGAYKGFPDQIQVAYTSGMATGTVHGKSFMMSLVKQAELNLKEISYELGGNEAPGDIGVQSFKNEKYEENRVALLSTALGSSAVSNWVAKNLRKYRRLRKVIL